MSSGNRTANALLTAITHGDLAAVHQQLASHPELVNRPNSHGNTPLLAAIASGDVRLVALLLERGADRFQTNHGGRSPLDAAAFGGHPAVFSLLVEAGSAASVHHLAALGRVTELQRLLEADATLLDVTHAGGRWRMSPLHAAARGASLPAVAALLAWNARVDATDHNGHTPLALIVEHPAAAERLAIATALLDAGANPSPLAGHHGGTALHRAIMHRDEAMTHLLLSRGADPLLRDWSGKTGLDRATERNQRLRRLVEAALR